jgi:NADH-quinone oxidoreductase subunit A
VRRGILAVILRSASDVSAAVASFHALAEWCPLGYPRSAARMDLQRKKQGGGAAVLDLPGRHGVDMTGVLADYLPLVIFIGISLVIGLALLVAPFIVAYKKPDPEKLSAYECGFNAFDDARMKFDVRFYLVAILFIILDLEVAFLFPWAVAFGELGWFGFWSMMMFLGVLTVGFVYEWKKGALDWD